MLGSSSSHLFKLEPAKRKNPAGGWISAIKMMVVGATTTYLLTHSTVACIGFQFD